MDQIKKIFDHFICIWKWFLSLFVFMFSAYFVFHCLNMFFVEKQASEFFATQLATRQSRNPQSRVHPEALATHSRLTHNSLVTHSRLARDSLAIHSRLEKIFAIEPSDSRKFSQLNLATRPVVKRPKSAFYRAFSWETCFKPLSSSLKPLFQYFYIKTQPIWMVFHSINISKVIINSFH